MEIFLLFTYWFKISPVMKPDSLAIKVKLRRERYGLPFQLVKYTPEAYIIK